MAMETTQDLLPARMLNEFTYCPRLAYLEWVQGEWEENADTLDGRFVHRNADQADRRAVTPPGPDDEAKPDPDKFHARSVRLEDQALGIVAVVDVLEVDGAIATPVDYKRGSVPNLPEQSWEPERVQLCAQGLLLRAAGFTSTQGIIWYAASRRRVTIPFTDLLIARTLDLITQCREMAKSQRMPLPLVDSPKCPRCSLVGICLPDETHLLRAIGSVPEEAFLDDSVTAPLAELRQLLAPRPEATPLHIVEPGARVGKKGDRLTIDLKEENLAEVRFKDVSHVCLYGPVQMSTQALTELLDREIPVCYFSGGGWFRGIATGLGHKNIELRIRQHLTFHESEGSLRLARAFVSAKIRNGRTLLRRNSNPPDEELLAALARSADEADAATSLESLLGIEGMAAKRYFSGFARLFKEERGFSFEGRNRRPPSDPVNAVLSFLYSVLSREMTVAVMGAGLDPFLGFLHRPRYGRPALALDLAEEFRPLLADSVVITLFNTAELQPGDFITRGNAVTLKPTAKKAVLGAWERRLNTEITHPVFGYTISYRRILMVQARLLGRVLSGELPEYPAFKTR